MMRYKIIAVIMKFITIRLKTKVLMALQLIAVGLEMEKHKIRKMITICRFNLLVKM